MSALPEWRSNGHYRAMVFLELQSRFFDEPRSISLTFYPVEDIVMAEG